MAPGPRRARPPLATALLAAALLAACCCAAASASPLTADRIRSGLRLHEGSDDNLRALRWMAQRLTAPDNKKRGGEEGAYLAIRYTVDPSMHTAFMDEWMKLGKTMRHADGLEFFQLSKTTTDNIEWWAYTEWATFKDLERHCDTDEVMRFNEFVDQNNVMVEAFPLMAVGDMKREYRADRGPAAAARDAAAAAAELERRRRRKDEDEPIDPRDMPAHTATTFHCPPSQRDNFEETMMEVQSRVADDDDDNRFFVVRKYATRNHHYVVRAGWDSIDGMFDHMQSKAFRTMRDCARESDIEWETRPFHVLASSEREDQE